MIPSTSGSSGRTQNSSKAFNLIELSSYALNYIREKKTTTFQEVTDKIIEISRQYETGSEKTTRRRVYDVINVFISAKLVERQNKQLTYVNKANLDNSDLYKQEQEISERIEALKQKIIEKANIYLKYMALIDRNKKAGVRPQNSIALPAIFVSFDNLQGDSCLSLDGKDLTITSEQAATYYSPTDLVTKLNLDIRAPDMDEQAQLRQNILNYLDMLSQPKQAQGYMNQQMSTVPPKPETPYQSYSQPSY